MRGLRYTASCRIRSNFSDSAICLMMRFARSNSAGKLLIAAQVEIFAVLALHALKVEVQTRQFLLLGTPVAFAHCHRFFFELPLQCLDLVFPALQFLGAGSKFLLELFARAFGRSRFPIDALRVDKSDFQIRRPGCRDAERQRQDSERRM